MTFVRPPNYDRIKSLYLDGPADLVIEVISPGSRGVDRGDKYVEYEQGGVPEYWLLDPDRKQHEFYQLGADGIYRLATVSDDDVYRSRSIPGLWIKPSWFWETPLPTVQTVIKAWNLS